MNVTYRINRSGIVFSDMVEYGLLAITPITFERETDNYYVSGSGKVRQFKDLSRYLYFSTWENAHEALKARARKQLDDARDSVGACERRITLVEAMTKPNFKHLT